MSDIQSRVAKSSFGTRGSVAAAQTVSTTRAAQIAQRSGQIRQQNNTSKKT